MDINGKGGVLRATINVTRKDTGKVDTYELVGSATPEEAAALIAAHRGTVHHGASGAVIAEGAKLTNEE